MSNIIEIKAVRAKDWSWWYVALTGANRCDIAEGSYTIAHIGANYYPMTASSRRDLLRKLYRRLGVQKLDWEVWDA